MQSLDSSHKWSSRESLSSTPSFLYSESDQTEDEGDVFSEGEGGRAPLDHFSLANATASAPASAATTASRTHRHSAGYQRNARPEGKLGGVDHHHHHHHHGQPPSCTATGPRSEGDLAFAQKCAELRGYLRPLLVLLNGLKTGRFDKGLNTFQQSVAIDRLQRIVGMLQKPHLGEKYLRTLHQVEMMLQTWFPQVRSSSSEHSSSSSSCSSASSSSSSSPPDRRNTTPSPSAHWHQDQLHIPVKKRRRSWSDSDSCSSIPPVSKRADGQRREEHAIGPDKGTPPTEEESTASNHGTDLTDPISDGTAHKAKQRRRGLGGGVPPLVLPPSSCTGNHVDTQDNFVSSTTPITAHMPHVSNLPSLQPLGKNSSGNHDALKEGELGEGDGTGEQHGPYSKEAAFTNSSVCSGVPGSENDT